MRIVFSVKFNMCIGIVRTTENFIDAPMPQLGVVTRSSCFIITRFECPEVAADLPLANKYVCGKVTRLQQFISDQHLGHGRFPRSHQEILAHFADQSIRKIADLAAIVCLELNRQHH